MSVVDDEKKRQRQERAALKLAWNAKIGPALQDWRYRQQHPRLTQADVAALLDLQRATISQIETGKRTLSLEEGITLAQEYGLFVEELLGLQARSPAVVDLLTLASRLPPEKMETLLEIARTLEREWTRQTAPPRPDERGAGG